MQNTRFLRPQAATEPSNLNYSLATFTRAAQHWQQYHFHLWIIKKLHKSLCYPDITRLSHYIKVKNLPYLLDNVKTIVRACRDCCKVKASFLKPKENLNLIKAIPPFERFSIDFKRHFQTVTTNKCLFVITDDISRFVFVYACKDMKACIVFKKLTDLFSLVGFYGDLHSDQGAYFMLIEQKIMTLTVYLYQQIDQI